MKIAVLGTGTVGTTIGSKLIALGHEVKMGSRTADNEKARAWVDAAGDRASQGTFADAAAFGELAFNCTAGVASVDAVLAAGPDNLVGKILLDLANPLDFSQGFPPRLSLCNDDSLGEAIQRALPNTKVVKTLNTVASSVMVDPTSVPGDHDIFVSGNDADAKATVTGFLREQFGWTHVVDLGDITFARGTEAWLLLWTRLYGVMGTPSFNLHLSRATTA
jgi:predicted dinucleotide-binding enzyme